MPFHAWGAQARRAATAGTKQTYLNRAPSTCFLTYSCQGLTHYVMKSGSSEKSHVTWTSHPTQLLQGQNYLLPNSSVPETLDQCISQTISLPLGSEELSKASCPLGKPCLEIPTRRGGPVSWPCRKTTANETRAQPRGTTQGRGFHLQVFLRSGNLLRANEGHRGWMLSTCTPPLSVR